MAYTVKGTYALHNRAENKNYDVEQTHYTTPPLVSQSLIANKSPTKFTLYSNDTIAFIGWDLLTVGLQKSLYVTESEVPAPYCSAFVEHTDFGDFMIFDIFIVEVLGSRDATFSYKYCYEECNHHLMVHFVIELSEVCREPR